MWCLVRRYETSFWHFVFVRKKTATQVLITLSKASCSREEFLHHEKEWGYPTEEKNQA